MSQTIFHTVKREDPYVRIDKAAIEDSRLSWRAKGILVYLLSKPKEWTVVCQDIVNHGTEKRDCLRAAMAELRDLGYAVLENTKDGRVWRIHETPIEPCPEKRLMATEPCPEKPNVALANMAISVTSKNNKIVSKNECSNEEFSLQDGDEEKPKKPKRKKGDICEEIIPSKFKTSPEFMRIWTGFVEMRDSKHPMTFLAAELMMVRLSRHSLPTVIEALTKSLTNNYRDVFFNESRPSGDEEVAGQTAAHPQYAGFIANHPSPTMKKYASWTCAMQTPWLKAEFNRFLREGDYAQ